MAVMLYLATSPKTYNANIEQPGPFNQVGDKRIGKRVLAEPYQTVERLHGSVAPFNRDYQEKSFQWMQGGIFGMPAGSVGSENVGEVCEKKYNMTVVKALMGRMPNNSIEQLINVCDSSKEFDCKLLFLVRDPRGIIPSSKAVGFYRDEDKGCLGGVEDVLVPQTAD
ncbi:hypothetical protein OS493_029128 [Desmophyllum pertusum]|uniref:Uncharacterized protein n=1 Tax=Desmophyllum pertusum TaxID=174260 RepID=A0A9X0CCW5_9CNID|nr:hypothetical protein OS493_029128 [Desmophyllum pertusum]